MDIDIDAEHREELQRLIRRRQEDAGAAAAAAEDTCGEETLQEAYKRLLTDAIARGEFGDDEEEEDGLDESDDLDDDDDGFRSLDELDAGDGYYPYPNKTVGFISLLPNLLNLTLWTQMSLMLRFAKCLGAPNVPTLKSLRKTQKLLQSTCGTEPFRIRSFLGNVFYVNDVREIIARDFANPVVAPRIQLFPEEVEAGSPISETWQADRWKEYSPSQLTPMFSRGNKRFWINELTMRRDGTFVIPLTLIIRKGVLTTDAMVVDRLPDGQFNCPADAPITTFPVDDLEYDFSELLVVLEPDSGAALRWTAASVATVPEMPNPDRKKAADDEDVVVIMVDAWQDDTSGNASKQWDKHLLTCIRNGNLPGTLLQQEFNVHAMCSSQNASCAEQFATLRDQINSTETNPIRCYDVHRKKKTAIILRAPGLPADNPQQSEESSHIGCNGNRPCRKCGWGGTTIEKTSAETYHQCHLPDDIKRSASQIRERLEEQLRLATRGDAKTIKQLQTATGTKDKLTQYWIEQALAQVSKIRDEDPNCPIDEISTRVQKWLEEQLGDKMNPLLDIPGLDPSQDTPVELLHTVLLGVIKYIWHFLNTKHWSDADRYLLAIRLQSTDISGLNIPPIRASYMIQYRNSLIGKHFKTLMQTLPLHVHSICTPEEFTLIKAAGDLGARLWITEIDNMEEYLLDLTTAVGNLLDAFDALDPLRILVKIKLHLLAHISEDIRRFGPAVRFSTEVFEAYNAIFRACSLRSNRLAPSRDIARKFASMERVKHLLCGGYWREKKTGSWVHAGSEVTQILLEDPVFQRHLGWSASKPVQCGATRLVSEKKEPALTWQSTKAASYWREALGNVADPDSKWRTGLTIVAQNGDIIRRSGWVYALGPDGGYLLARVAEILVGTRTLVTLERFICTEVVHADYGWPVARRPCGTEITEDGITSFLVVAPSALQFGCSVQHDCRRGKCKPAVMGKRRQEREDTTHDMHLIKHTDDDYFFVNMAGLHNFRELRRTLPKALTQLKPLHLNRKAFHDATALRAQDLRMTVREKAARKRREKAAEKKRLADLAVAEAEAAERAAQGDGEEEEEEEEEEDTLVDPDDEEQHQDESDDDGGDPDEDEDEDESGDFVPAAARGPQRGRGGMQTRSRTRARQ
ncbi:hypothetical protein C8F01DRAFT_1003912 [Mycena amicta]|nr:hypothetical protein C8F01DRAFT_1003912 [Mycena amicta]